MLPATRSIPSSSPKPVAARKRWRALVFFLLLLLLGYGSYRAVRTDPNLKKVRELQAELFTAQAQNMPGEERMEKFRQLREATKNLAPEDRRDLSAERRKRFEDELKRYHDMSPDEKLRFLDERIRTMEQARQNRPNAEGNAQGNGPGRGGLGAGGPGGPGTPGGGGAAGMSMEERDRRRRQRLDDSTPEFRALMTQFVHDIQARRQQLGLPSRGR